MITLTRIFKLNNYILKKLCRPPPPVKKYFFFFHIYLLEVYYGRLFKNLPGDDLPSRSY